MNGAGATALADRSRLHEQVRQTRRTRCRGDCCYLTAAASPLTRPSSRWAGVTVRLDSLAVNGADSDGLISRSFAGADRSRLHEQVGQTRRTRLDNGGERRRVE